MRDLQGQPQGDADALAVQLPFAKDVCGLLGYTVVTCEGYEADDLLGTIAAAAEREGDECVLVTGDRDSFQLVSPHVSVYLAANSETKVYDPARIAAEYGVAPAQLVDVKAIMATRRTTSRASAESAKRARWR